MKTKGPSIISWQPRQYVQMIPVCQACGSVCGLEDAKGRGTKVIAVCPKCKRSIVVYDHERIKRLLKIKAKVR
jgi:hypothetical protein